MKQNKPTYKIIRGYFNDREHDSEVIKTGLTLQQAQKHCQSKETSSRTCTSPENIKRTEEKGPWFDSYVEEA